MSILLIMAIAAIGLILSGRFYAPIIAKALGEKKDRQTPAVLVNDGQDYVPTKTPVVFAHHFASIAGAGPIIGPVLALIYGWGPTLFWIVVGGMFFGAVHDFVATHVAMREGGKSITITAKRYIGRAAFIMLLFLLVAILAIVCAAFLDASARALTSSISLTDLGLSESQSVFRMENNKAVIGGIASTSVIVITLCSPILGFLYLKRKWPVGLCSIIAMGICVFSIWIGFYFPLSIDPQYWKIIISAYVLISAGLPVWLFLQSRDFINVHMLYVGIAFMFVALIAAALQGGGAFTGATPIPFNNIEQGTEKLGFIWPIMFITIACGAVSGFHSLCAGGTTCKQLSTEAAARHVGFNGMLLESFFSVCVVCCLLVGLSMTGYEKYCYPTDPNIKGNWILTFAVGVGHTVHAGLGIPVWAGLVGAMLLLEGFLVTTLDTAIRLMRYMIEEGWSTFFAKYDVFSEGTNLQGELPQREELTEVAGTGGMHLDAIEQQSKNTGLRPIESTGLMRSFLQLLNQYWFNAGLAVLLMVLLGLGGGYKKLWILFGASNQLLASLALLICSTWLLKRGRTIKFTLIPATFMLATSTYALIKILVEQYHAENWMLFYTDIFVLSLTGGIITFILKSWQKTSKQKVDTPQRAQI